MRRSLLFAVTLLFADAVCAQMELPPGTRSVGNEPVKAAGQSAADPAAAELLKAETAIEQRQYPAAVALLQTVTGRRPKKARAWYDLGFAQEASGDDAAARVAYRTAVALDANDLRSGVSLGLLLARTGDRAGAKAALEAASSLEDGDAGLQARAYRALAQLDMPKEPEKARDAMVAALRLSPETADDVVLTGRIAEALGDGPAAVAAYGRAVAMAPEDAGAAEAYAHVLLRGGEAAKAEAVLRAALKTHTDDPALLAGLAGALLKQSKPEEAVPLLVRMHGADRANLAVTRLLAHTYAVKEQWAEANPLYAELLLATPDDPALLADWGDALIRQKRNGEAEAVLKKAVAVPERFATREALAEAAGELAFAAENNGDPATVLRAGELRNGILAPDAKTAFLLATAHDRLHHTREAVELYRQFVHLAGDGFPEQKWQAEQRIAALSHTR